MSSPTPKSTPALTSDSSTSAKPSTKAPPRICVFCSTQLGLSPVNAEAATSLAQVLHARGAQLVYGGGSSGLMGTVARERVRLGGPEAVMGVIPYALVDSERQGRGKDGVRDAVASMSTNSTPSSPSIQTRKNDGTGVGGKLKSLLRKKETNNGSAGEGDSGAKVEDGEVPEIWQTWQDVYVLPTDPAYGAVVGTPSLAQRKAVMMEMVARGGPGSGFVALPGGFGSLDEVLTVLTGRQLGQHRRDMVLVNVDGFWDGLERWMDEAVQKGFLGEESRGFVTVVATVEEAVGVLMRDA